MGLTREELLAFASGEGDEELIKRVAIELSDPDSAASTFLRGVQERSEDICNVDWMAMALEADEGEDDSAATTSTADSRLSGGTTAARRSVRRRILVGVNIAAALLVGIIVGQFRLLHKSERELELLLARVIPKSRTLLGGPEQSIRPDELGIYRSEGEFDVTIRSPRRGWATIVLVPGQPSVFPREGEAQFRIEPLQPRGYGPLSHDGKPTTVLVIVTDKPASELIRETVTRKKASEKEIDELLFSIQDALWKAGHQWAAVDSIMVAPLGG